MPPIVQSSSSSSSSDPAVVSPVATASLTQADKDSRLLELHRIVEAMVPAVQADGGDLKLLSADVSTGVVELQLSGSCSSCSLSEVTLYQGIERILRDRLPWFTELVSSVEESDEFIPGMGSWTPAARYD